VVYAAREVRDMRRFGFVFTLATMAATLLALFAATVVMAKDVWPPH
jgi:hypothetical protein